MSETHILYYITDPALLYASTYSIGNSIWLVKFVYILLKVYISQQDAGENLKSPLFLSADNPLFLPLSSIFLQYFSSEQEVILIQALTIIKANKRPEGASNTSITP